MRLTLVSFVCAHCEHVFDVPELPVNAYGEFLLRSAGAGETRYLNALQDLVFSEVEAILKADTRIATLPLTRRLKLLRDVYGPAACDPDASSKPLHIGLHECPACGSQEMRSWAVTSPAQWIDLEVPSVSHSRWSCLSPGQKSELVLQTSAKPLFES